MARTFRRKKARYEYRWVLYNWTTPYFAGPPVQIDPRTTAGRKALARFHSDKSVSLGSSAPRWYRKIFDHRIRTGNDRMLRRWLANPEFDPVFRTSHKHGANWSWW